MVTAALSGGHVADLGPAEVDGIEADQYRIEADDATREALAELAPTELAWFELEHPQQVTSIEIWVADDLIRRIEVTVDHSDSPTERQVATTTVDYFDFHADIEITPLTSDTTPGP